jgi:hypothetical protein
MQRLRSLGLIAATTLALVGGPPVQAGTDAADTCGAATPIGTAWITELSGTGDRDWFRFSLAARRRVIVTLGALPAGARLDLYRACSDHVAGSDRPGQHFEELVRVLDAGTYRIRVRPLGTWVQPMPYRVRVNVPPGTVHVLSSSGWNEFPDKPRIAGEVLNNTGQARQDVRIRIRFYDAADHLIRVGYTYARRERFGAGQRSMFVWSAVTIPGYHHHRAKVVGAPLADLPPFRGLEVHPSGTTDEGFGVLSYNGSLENTTAFTVTIPRVMVTIYDGLGRVRNADFASPDDEPLDPFESSPYSVVINDRNTGDRVVTKAHGYKGPGG